MEQRQSRETRTRIFISHSHSDKAIAFKLVNFLLCALRIEEEEIFFSSNPDQGLSNTGDHILNKLKNELENSEALIVLITANSLNSDWILYEVGAFSSADKLTDKLIIPILGSGLTLNDLPGPLKYLLGISIDAEDWQGRVNNAINKLVKRLKIEQKVTGRRDFALQEFSDSLKARQLQNQERLQQEEIEELTQILEDKERSHYQQLEELEQSYQTQIEEKDSKINRSQELIEQLLKLNSERGVNYTKLHDHLAAGEWEEADKETVLKMQEVANRKEECYLDNEHIDNFPCEDLRIINQLWVKYSDGRFGFSVQKEIYFDLDGTVERRKKRFVDRVGWQEGEGWELRDTTYLPMLYASNSSWRCVMDIDVFFSRVQTCRM